jgi:ribosomal protein S27E
VLGRINAISVYLAWAGFLLFFVWLIYAWSTDKHEYDYVSLLTIGSSVFFGLVHFILAFFVRCTHCGKCLTIQTFKKPHSESDGDWSTTIFKWFGGQVSCIHCGQKVNTNGL